MDRHARRQFGEALAWLAFPVVPVVLARLYCDVINFSIDGYGGPDPYEWDREQWLRMLGPLLGFGFLAGATLDLPDDPGARGWRSWPSRRAVWVAVGPWVGLLAWGALYFLIVGIHRVFPQVADLPLDRWWSQLATEPVQWALALVSCVLPWATLHFAWLLPAAAVLRRARAQGRFWRALVHGLVVTAAFVGSLFGGFWAVTQACRSYFFDKTVVPVVVAGLSLVAISGCASTITYGEVRRRELFPAMLVSWVFGLAVLWRWWGRRRSRR